MFKENMNPIKILQNKTNQNLNNMIFFVIIILH